jgi:Capsule polysaccharide biosynthesis protein
MSLSSRSRRALGGLRARLARRTLPLGRPVRLRRGEDLPYEDPQYFAASGARFLRSLKQHNQRRAHASDGPRIGVVITPWVRTPVPWYATMLALGLERRGREVILLWDDAEFPREPTAQNRVIRRVLRHLGGSRRVVHLSDQIPRSSDDPGADAAAVKRLAEQNVTWWLRGASPAPRDANWVDDIQTALAERLPLVRGAVDQLGVECLVVPGGIYGTSGLYCLAAAEQGTRVATFDTDRGVAQICADGVAAQNGDLARAFHVLCKEPRDVKQDAIEVARVEFRSRAEGSDRYGYQAVGARPATGARSGGVLMPLNVEWDTAALGRHVAFTDTVDWVSSTVEMVLDLHPGPVIVRQHPSERRPGQRSRLDLAGVLRDRFGQDPRYSFVAAEDRVSSYDLLDSVDLVLPFTSNIGIEAAALGKTVLVAGASFYADLGFTWSATSREEYLALLRRGLLGDLPPWREQQDRAWLCYYLVAVTNRIWTDFTSHPDDFWSWVRRSPDELFAEAEVADMLAAIDDDVPVSLLRHRRARSVGGQ